VFFSRVYCPFCRVEHEWFAKDAWVCDSEPFVAHDVLRASLYSDY
jgi:hypothetical protein